MKYLLTISLISILITGCGGGDQHESNGIDAADQLVLVLCDMTRSVDTAVSTHVIRSAKEIFNKFEDSTRFGFYYINDGDYNKQFLLFDRIRPVNPRKSESDAYNQRIVSVEDSIGTLLQFDSTKYVYQKTCITLGLNTAYEQVVHYKRNHPGGQVLLYILSDMIEDCNADKRFGAIDFTRSSGVLSVLQRKWEYEVTHNLREAGARIIVVFESENLPTVNNGRQTGATRSQLELGWRKLFQQFGYSQQSDSVQFSLLQVPD